MSSSVEVINIDENNNNIINEEWKKNVYENFIDTYKLNDFPKSNLCFTIYDILNMKNITTNLMNGVFETMNEFINRNDSELSNLNGIPMFTDKLKDGYVFCNCDMEPKQLSEFITNKFQCNVVIQFKQFKYIENEKSLLEIDDDDLDVDCYFITCVFRKEKVIDRYIFIRNSNIILYSRRQSILNGNIPNVFTNKQMNDCKKIRFDEAPRLVPIHQNETKLRKKQRKRQREDVTSSSSIEECEDKTKRQRNLSSKIDSQMSLINNNLWVPIQINGETKFLVCPKEFAPHMARQQVIHPVFAECFPAAESFECQTNDSIVKFYYNGQYFECLPEVAKYLFNGILK